MLVSQQRDTHLPFEGSLPLGLIALVQFRHPRRIHLERHLFKLAHRTFKFPTSKPYIKWLSMRGIKEAQNKKTQP